MLAWTRKHALFFVLVHVVPTACLTYRRMEPADDDLGPLLEVGEFVWHAACIDTSNNAVPEQQCIEISDTDASESPKDKLRRRPQCNPKAMRHARDELAVNASFARNASASGLRFSQRL